MASAGIGDRVEGVHAVSAAMAAGRVVSLRIDEKRRDIAELADLAAAALGRGIEVEFVAELDAVTAVPQGVVATASPIPLASVEEVAGSVDPAAVLVLDHLEDPRNVGAAVRSAVAAGFGGLIVPSRRGAPLGASAFKAAAGALEHLRVAVVSSIPKTIEELRRLDVWVVGLDGDAGQSLLGLQLLAEPVAVVVGAEGSGLSRLVAERCDVLAAIPLRAEVESLNSSVAAALACFETARVRGWVT